MKKRELDIDSLYKYCQYYKHGGNMLWNML